MDRMPLVRKTLIGLFSLVLGISVWAGVAAALFKSGISPLQNLALWISHFSLFGWLLGITISVAFYRMISIKLFPPKS
jgi:hypothetical protein